MKATEVEMDISDREYEDVLDEIYGDVQIAGMTYSTGHALAKLDPTAFRCGKVDYEDTLDHKWACGLCGEEFDTEAEAEDCCTTDEDDTEAEDN